jgi:hypothetical protein
MKLNELNWAHGENLDKRKSKYVAKGHVVVWVKIKDVIDNMHSDFRISPDSSENRIGQRFEKAVEHFKANGWMDLTSLGWNDHWKTVDVGDGRHRLAAALSLGEVWAPVTVDKSDIDELKKVIGLRETEPK